VQLVDIARANLSSFMDAIRQGVDRPLAALDLREATEAIGAIVGGADFAEIYPLVFSRFCVGK
jgi:tRNA U34 5-carboxymethylaminomethyl modifying GTPase MnmE/TrmE